MQAPARTPARSAHTRQLPRNISFGTVGSASLSPLRWVDRSRQTCGFDYSIYAMRLWLDSVRCKKFSVPRTFAWVNITVARNFAINGGRDHLRSVRRAHARHDRAHGARYDDWI